MSKLEELIERLCPDGVERKALKDVAPVVRESVDVTTLGNHEFLGVQDLLQNKLGIQEPLPKLPDSGRVHRFQPGDVLIGNIRPYLKKIWHADREGGTSGDVIVVRPGNDVDDRYMFYVLSADGFFEYDMSNSKGSKMPRGDRASIEKYAVPVPPIEVQREIVRILDSMQELDDALSEELNVRQHQLAQYRRDMLAKVVGKRTTLGGVSLNVCSGATPKKSERRYYDDAAVPWLRTQEVTFNEITEVSAYISEYAVEKTSVRWIPENCLIIAISGASAGRCAVNKIPLTTNQHCCNMELDPEKVLYDYAFQWTCDKYEELIRMKDGPRGDLNSSKIKGLEIVLPPLAEQADIVNKLKAFSELECLIEEERGARRKQFEYYRDKLLDFPEKVG